MCVCTGVESGGGAVLGEGTHGDIFTHPAIALPTVCFSQGPANRGPGVPRPLLEPALPVAAAVSCDTGRVRDPPSPPPGLFVLFVWMELPFPEALCFHLLGLTFIWGARFPMGSSAGGGR